MRHKSTCRVVVEGRSYDFPAGCTMIAVPRARVIIVRSKNGLFRAFSAAGIVGWGQDEMRALWKVETE